MADNQRFYLNIIYVFFAQAAWNEFMIEKLCLSSYFISKIIYWIFMEFVTGDGTLNVLKQV